MHIIVCLKQVPATDKVKIDPKTNTLIREGLENIINPYDAYALEEAIRWKEKLGARVTVLSMGLPRVVDLLRDALALGADQAILLSDRKFAGADTLATAYTLSKAIEKIGDYQLVICGKQAIDGDTAQVGPSLAAQLAIPHTAYVNRIVQIDNFEIRCKRITDEGYETLELHLPALLTVVKEINVPRLPSLAGLRKAWQAKIQIWTAQELGVNEKRLGLSGSPTQVKKTFVPIHNVKTQFLSGVPQDQAQALAEKLIEMGLYSSS